MYIERSIHMKIILKNEVAGLGEEGDVLVVSDGYARNFLFPSKYAVMYNTQNISVLQSQKIAIEKRKKERRTAYLSLKEKLEAMTLVIKMKTGESGHLFGAVTSTVIADELEKQGIEIFKKQILVPHHSIKEIGDYEIDIKLLGGIAAILKIEVVDIEGKVQQVTHVEEPPVEASIEDSGSEVDQTEVEYPSSDSTIEPISEIATESIPDSASSRSDETNDVESNETQDSVNQETANEHGAETNDETPQHDTTEDTTVGDSTESSA